MFLLETSKLIFFSNHEILTCCKIRNFARTTKLKCHDTNFWQIKPQKLHTTKISCFKLNFNVKFHAVKKISCFKVNLNNFYRYLINFSKVNQTLIKVNRTLINQSNCYIFFGPLRLIHLIASINQIQWLRLTSIDSIGNRIRLRYIHYMYLNDTFS